MSKGSSSVGLGFCDVLTIIFVVLKLCGVISWSWWWVLSPFWIGTIIWILVFVGAYIYCVLDSKKYTKKDKGKWKF